MTETTKQVAEALKVQGWDSMYINGRFACRRTNDTETTWFTLTQARKVTGIAAPTRQVSQRISSYGDFAMIAAINGRLNG